MLESSVNTELQNVIDKLISFWGKNISNIDIKSITDKPFDMFTLSIILYGKHDVLIEYDRSTLGFYVKKDGEYIALSRLSKDPIYRGFDGYSSDNNILHNFKELDNILKDENMENS